MFMYIFIISFLKDKYLIILFEVLNVNLKMKQLQYIYSNMVTFIYYQNLNHKF